MGQPDSEGRAPTMVIRLVTFVDLDDKNDPGADAYHMHLSARHEAELDNGGRVLLLGDRGWSGSGSSHIWSTETIEQIADEARVVVGPDEPNERHGETYELMEAYHYGMLDGILRQRGICAGDLRSVPHSVELSERVLARLGRGEGHS